MQYKLIAPKEKLHGSVQSSDVAKILQAAEAQVAKKFKSSAVLSSLFHSGPQEEKLSFTATHAPTTSRNRY
jgi:hypothetical protein